MHSNQAKYPPIPDIDIQNWCRELQCEREHLLYCIERVGTSWISVEAFWSMNADRIRAVISTKKNES